MERNASNPIATFLREHRLVANVSLRKRAKEIGLDPSYLSRLESGAIIAGPVAIGRVLVVLSEKEAQELLRRYFEDAAATITQERTKVIEKSYLKSDQRQLKIGVQATYSEAETTKHQET